MYKFIFYIDCCLLTNNVINVINKKNNNINFIKCKQVIWNIIILGNKLIVQFGTINLYHKIMLVIKEFINIINK